MWVAIWLYVGSLYLNKQFRQVNSDTGNVGASNRVSTRIIRSDCSSFRPSVSVTSKGRASVHVYNGAIRIDQIGYRNGDISAISVYYEPVNPTRKEGRAQILQKPTQGHENFQHPWSSRRHSDMKTFKHEDFQT